jgi:hypothetical protein
MARLAAIKSAIRAPGQPATTIYVNPLNVALVEPLPNGARITLNDEKFVQTTVGVDEVVTIIQEAML